MAYEDKHPDTLADIALYAGYAADTIRNAQQHLRTLAGFLGADGDFLRNAADMIGNAIDDEIDDALRGAHAALESGVPQMALIAAHRDAAAAFRRA
jgi:hypothetical protein